MKVKARAALMAGLVVLISLGTAFSYDTPFDKLSHRVNDAGDVVEEMLKDPNFSDTITVLLKRCRAIMIFPSVTRGGFIFAGRFGRGVMLVKDKKIGLWSPPAFYTLGGGSVGFQVGIQKIDLVLFVMNDRGAKALMKGKVTLGADISVAMGPIGVAAAADTDVLLKSEIYAYSKAKGVFAGISLKGATVKPDLNANCVYYGKSDVMPGDILIEGRVKPPESARRLMDLLNNALKEEKEKK